MERAASRSIAFYTSTDKKHSTVNTKLTIRNVLQVPSGGYIGTRLRVPQNWLRASCFPSDPRTQQIAPDFCSVPLRCPDVGHSSDRGFSFLTEWYAYIQP